MIFLRGGDRFTFLQPLISNDLAPVEAGKVIWAAHLTPQGKFAYDLLIGAFEDVIILETEARMAQDFLSALQGFKLSDDVELAFGGGFNVYALSRAEDAENHDGRGKDYGYGLAFPDPRAEDLGYRFWGREEDFALMNQGNSLATEDSENAYHARRIAAYVPENSQKSHADLIYGKTLLLEAGFDALGGIDWQKGCYVGQELTARTKYRGLVKRCLVAVTCGTDFTDDNICDAAGNIIGDIRSRALTENGTAIGLAGMRLGDLDKELFCGKQKLNLHVPNFLRKA